MRNDCHIIGNKKEKGGITMSIMSLRDNLVEMRKTLVGYIDNGVNLYETKVMTTIQGALS